jgi:hypothetical protein
MGFRRRGDDCSALEEHVATTTRAVASPGRRAASEEHTSYLNYVSPRSVA